MAKEAAVKQAISVYSDISLLSRIRPVHGLYHQICVHTLLRQRADKLAELIVYRMEQSAISAFEFGRVE